MPLDQSLNKCYIIKILNLGVEGGGEKDVFIYIVSDSVNRGMSTARKTRASLYGWIIYKRGSKARERKGEEEQRRSK